MSEPQLLGKFPSILCSNVMDTSEVGKALANCLYCGLLVLLSGELGSGKTELVRSIGRTLGIADIKSPTFAIESVYRPAERDFILVHADLFRLDDPSGEIEQLEAYLMEDCAVIVEWGDMWKNPPVNNRWDIEITSGSGDEDENRRMMSMAGFGMDALSRLSEAYLRMPDAVIAGGGRSCR
ncbi:MAG: tRNA (adenosine(37)-N6)-threonylcarbamoyltransferase complex ATPase subunit type 1 TsaE [Synergistaceae bacterium]|nr:tRNA (adenosine(37)-N6)-threonylcarbamoyltransferase complex ATPase subunit type 1 TsaE [Synergistaceae bacterium]